MSELPLIRSHERMDYKRCPKKWYWKWRRGLVPKAITVGPMELGTWVHEALANWYEPGLKRSPTSLAEWFIIYADNWLLWAQTNNAPDYVLEQAEELIALGEIMCRAYQEHYGNDKFVNVIGAEIPLDFSIGNPEGEIVAHHLLKPDMVFRDPDGNVLLLENKTAGSIQTDHLSMDDQARPYGVMAEQALRKIGAIGRTETVKGILYNFLRKAIPDERMTNEKGQALNKNGTVSKKQPAPLFVRKLITLTKPAKRIALMRIQSETILITTLTTMLREKMLDPAMLPKTPSKACPKFCQFFGMCEAEEKGIDIRQMERVMYRRENPYLQYGESTEDITSFEMG